MKNFFENLKNSSSNFFDRRNYKEKTKRIMIRGYAFKVPETLARLTAAKIDPSEPLIDLQSIMKKELGQ